MPLIGNLFAWPKRLARHTDGGKVLPEDLTGAGKTGDVEGGIKDEEMRVEMSYH